MKLFLSVVFAVFCSVSLALFPRSHPLKYKLEDQSSIDLRDSTGKLFLIAITEVAKTKGSGWMDYMWPKPGEKPLR